MAKKRKPVIKAVVFDLGGVVMHGGYLEFINHYCAPCLTPLGRKKILDLEHRVNLGELSERGFYRLLREVFGLHLSEKQMRRLITQKMRADRALLRIFPRLHPAKVALFTNSIGHMALDVLKSRRVPAKKLFDRVFVSSKIHYAKPDRDAYRYVLRQLKVRPSEALMVDDRIENIRGAKKAGMHGIVYKNARQFKAAMKKYELK